MTSTPQEVKKLIEIYEKAQKDLIQVIAEKEIRGNVTTYYKSLIVEVNQQLEQLNQVAKEWVEKTIPMAYQDGIHTVVSGLQSMGVTVNVQASLSMLHTQAIENIMLDMLDDLYEASNFVFSSIDGVVRRTVSEIIANKIATGMTIRQAKDKIIAELAKQGITAVEDSKGRRMNLSSYAALLARSRTREATNKATMNQLTELGYDLVKMSSHRSSCPICAKLEGRVYSISGKHPDYPPLSVAFKGPYANVHPNCAHVFVPYIPELADDPEKDRERSRQAFDFDPRSKREVEVYHEEQRRKQKLRSNRRQWERYRMTLPEDTPKTFQGFMNMKRSQGDRWEELQKDYRKIMKVSREENEV